MNNAQPGLRGALFVFGKKNKKAGAEDGKAAKKIRLQTESDDDPDVLPSYYSIPWMLVSQSWNFLFPRKLLIPVAEFSE